MSKHIVQGDGDISVQFSKVHQTTFIEYRKIVVIYIINKITVFFCIGSDHVQIMKSFAYCIEQNITHPEYIKAEGVLRAAVDL